MGLSHKKGDLPRIELPGIRRFILSLPKIALIVGDKLEEPLRGIAGAMLKALLAKKAAEEGMYVYGCVACDCPLLYREVIDGRYRPICCECMDAVFRAEPTEFVTIRPASPNDDQLINHYLSPDLAR